MLPPWLSEVGEQYAVETNTCQSHEKPTLYHKAHEKGEELFDAVADLRNMKLWKYPCGNQAFKTTYPGSYKSKWSKTSEKKTTMDHDFQVLISTALLVITIEVP